jgi:hypothetical protein
MFRRRRTYGAQADEGRWFAISAAPRPATRYRHSCGQRKDALVARLQDAKRRIHHSDHWAQGQMPRPRRFVTRQLMVPCRAVSHATIRLAALRRDTLPYRVVSAFQTPSGSQAVFVMDVLCKCTRTGKHRCKQSGNREQTHCVPPLFSTYETNSRTNRDDKPSILSCPCRIF